MTLSTRRPGSRFPTPTPSEPNGSAAPPGTDGQQRNSVVLGPKDRLVGQLFIEGDLRVSGKVEGTLEATGDIEIAGAGTVSGTVTAYNRLVVGGGASLIGGDVRVARLTVEDGATFTGRVSMGKAALEEPKAPEPVVEAAPPPEAQPQPQPAVQSKGKRR